MRILAVAPGPAFSVHDVYVGWCEGLRDAGCQVARFNLEDRLAFYEHAMLERGGEIAKAMSHDQAVQAATFGMLGAAYQFNPDVVLIVSAFFVAPEVLDLFRTRGSKVVILHTESPYEDDRQARIGEHADLNLLNDPTNVGQFANGMYVPHAYRPQIHRPGPAPSDARSDFCFVGTGYPSRVAFLEAVDFDGIDVALAGNWQDLGSSSLRKFVAHDEGECVDNTQAVVLYRGAKASANLYRREAERPELSAGWAMGPREVELAATGTFYLREPRPEGDEVLPMLPKFASPEDFGEQLRWWLAHDDERQEAARKAREAIADRTFINNARRLLAALDK